MSRACCGEPKVTAARRGAAASTVAHALTLGAAPTFALMALWSGLCSDQSTTICIGMRDTLSVNGMALMYAFMSIFHAAPWLRVISRCE